MSTHPSPRESLVVDWEAALERARLDGCGPETAEAERVQPGPKGSRDIASRDWPRLQDLVPAFERAAVQYGLPTSLLLAVASRESHAGAALDANGWGDGGHAFGVLQVDMRFHRIAGAASPTSHAHLLQGAGILRRALVQVVRKHPSWPPEKQLEGALCAYNSGVNNVQTLIGMNRGTTHNDYGADTLARAQWYQVRLDAQEST
jgi:hypothetical protein